MSWEHPVPEFDSTVCAKHPDVACIPPPTCAARRRTPSEKARLVTQVDEYRARGGSAVAACKACGISFPSYQAWRQLPNSTHEQLEALIRDEFERANFQLDGNRRSGPRGRTPIDTLVAMYGATDAKLQKHPLIAQTLDAMKYCRFTRIEQFSKYHTRVYLDHYARLPPHARALIQRVLQVPPNRWFSTYYPLMSEAAWARYASRFSSKSSFDARGGVWLSRNHPEWYRRVFEQGCEWWFKHKALDGVQYASRAELIVANLLFLNSDTTRYTPTPVLPFGMGGRRMRGDFDVRLRSRPSDPGDSSFSGGVRFLVEVWGWTTEREDSPYVAKYLRRRSFKLTHISEYPAPLIQIEAEVLRLKGVEAFIDHVLARFGEVGIHLRREQGIAQSTAWKHPREWSANDFAEEFYRAGCANVTAAQRHSHPRLKMLGNLCVNELKCVPAVEPLLAGLWGRMARIRKDWAGSGATEQEVAAYVKAHDLSKSAYCARYDNNLLPPGFPSSPLQTYEGWSWRRARKGVATRDMIRDYEAAKALVQKWQADNHPILSRAEYRHAFARDEQLRFLPKLPEHPETGLNDWVDWADFLGQPSIRRTAEKHARNRTAVALLKTKGRAAILRHLKSLGCENVGQVCRLNPRLYTELKTRPDYERLALELSGRPTWILELDAVLRLFRRHRIDSVRRFLELRPRVRALQVVPAKVERYPSLRGLGERLQELKLERKRKVKRPS